MFVGVVVLMFKYKLFNKYVICNVLFGLLWGIGNLFLFFLLLCVGVVISFLLF